jgi:hypothetical protein
MSYSRRHSSDESEPSRWSKLKASLALPIVIVGFLLIGFSLFNGIAISGTSTGCVVKEKVNSPYGNSKYNRVYVEGCNGRSEVKVFLVRDNWSAGQLAPNDTYAKIEVGKTYDFETRGMHIPRPRYNYLQNHFFLQNIVRVTEAAK